MQDKDGVIGRSNQRRVKVKRERGGEKEEEEEKEVDTSGAASGHMHMWTHCNIPGGLCYRKTDTDDRDGETERDYWRYTHTLLEEATPCLPFIKRHTKMSVFPSRCTQHADLWTEDPPPYTSPLSPHPRLHPHRPLPPPTHCSWSLCCCHGDTKPCTLKSALGRNRGRDRQ